MVRWSTNTMACFFTRKRQCFHRTPRQAIVVTLPQRTGTPETQPLEELSGDHLERDLDMAAIPSVMPIVVQLTNHNCVEAHPSNHNMMLSSLGNR